MSPLAGLVRGSRVRRWLPYIVVMFVLAVVLVSAISSESTGRESFAFGVYFPPPSSYSPGASPPNAFLQINYTGQGVGNYSYTIRYNTSSGIVVAARGNALVSGQSPFTAFVSIPAGPSAVTVATAEVFRGNSAQSPIFEKSIVL